MTNHLKQTYISLITLSIMACIYVYIRPGIAPPEFPSDRMESALRKLGNTSPTKVQAVDLGMNSSDRMLSKLYHYDFNDGSKLLTLLVRVRRRGDFRIESYGPLTKGISPIYIKSPSDIDVIPQSLFGKINNKEHLQTCIVPMSRTMDEVGVGLDLLASTADKYTKHSSGFFGKLLGLSIRPDYTCLVVTYQLPRIDKKSNAFPIWRKIVLNAQHALYSIQEN